MGMSDEAWLSELGVSFIDVWFQHRGSWVIRPQVADPETLDICIEQELRRPNITYALWHDGHWQLWSLRKGRRTYPTREAAEMVAIHNG